MIFLELGHQSEVHVKGEISDRHEGGKRETCTHTGRGGGWSGGLAPNYTESVLVMVDSL